MAKDARALREEAAEATSSGKYKRALAAYLELERLEPRDAQWAKRAGETYKRLNNNKHAIEAFERSAERYAQNGFLVQAIAVCKLILQIDPQHADTLRRLATMSDQVGAGPTRAGGMAENNPALYENPNVAALRRPRSETDPSQSSSGIPQIVGGTGSRPIETFSRSASAHEFVPVAIPDGRGSSDRSQPIAVPPVAPIVAGGQPTQPGTYELEDPDEPSEAPLDLSADLDAVAAAPDDAQYGRTQPMDPLDLPPVEPPRNVAPQRQESIARITPVRVAMPVTHTQPMPALPRAPAIPPGPPPVAAPAAPANGTARTQPLGVLPALGALARPAIPRPPTFGTAGTQPMPRLEPQVATTHSTAPALSRTKSSSRVRLQPTPPPQLSRTKSRPISLPLGASLNEVALNKQVENSRRRESSVAGVHIIPIGDEIEISVDSGEIALAAAEQSLETESDPALLLEVEVPEEVFEGELEEQTELEMEDIEEIGMAQPKAIGTIAQRALAATPLFAGLPSEALAGLVAQLALVHLMAGDVLFHEGDAADALYVIAEGELAIQGEGPPRVELARLGPGQFIGEIALMTDQPRSATVSAITDVELLRVDRHTLSRVLGEHGDVLRAVLRFVRDRLVDRWIRTSPLFRPFDPESRAELAARFSFLEIDADTTLIGKGQRPDGLYIVLAGGFNVVREGAIVITLGPGDLIGEVALLSGGAFRSDVIATGKSLALCLPAAVFREVIMTHPHVLEYIGEHAESSRRLQIL